MQPRNGDADERSECVMVAQACPLSQFVIH